MSTLAPADFAGNARAALADPQLRRALRVMADTFSERRQVALAGVDDWESLRERARRIKDETLRDLERYLADFTRNAERAGARVHRAQDAGEACATITDLVRRCGAGAVVKSKSMVTEEIHLNRALEAAGVEVVETDLGEWIVQLAGETPSHIVVPAIHKSKAQIATLLAERLGVPLTDDAAELAGHARRVLRDRFRSAQVGITGVNFAVAETGTIVIIENEGNVRLTSSIPKVHIAVMGIEKVIPRFADLDVFLKLLPRSGTGQALTVYQSFITGVAPRTDAGGPDELHIVLLDNGRSRLLDDPVTRQTLACIRCGACLNVCPVYQQVGGHAYGSVYPGPIGAVLTPQLEGLGKAGALAFASSLCGACRDVCPVKIDIPQVLLHLRSRIAEGSGDGLAATNRRAVRKLGERLAIRASTVVLCSPKLYGWLVRVLRRLQRVGLRPPVPAWTAGRELRPLADQSFREWWKTHVSH